MNTIEFEYLRRLLYDRSGLVVTRDKMYLIENRLMPIARQHGLNSIDALVGLISRGCNDATISQIVEAMTTNETLFFRDGWPFERLKRSLLPDIMSLSKIPRRIRIWSAACSSGQEPYSLAMTLAEMGPALPVGQVEIVATDISPAMLARAREGRYSAFEVSRGLPDPMLKKYFTADRDGWRAKDNLKAMIEFRSYNLLEDPVAAGIGLFDVIFCRNVLIYFDEPTRKRVFQSLARVLRPWGCLCLGGAETVVGISDAFRVLPGERGLFGLAAKFSMTDVA